MMAENVAIAFRYILDSRDRAILIDLGEEKPVWFQRSKIVLDEQNYTLTGPKQLIAEKLKEARGGKPEYNPFDKRMIKLEPPEWQITGCEF
jgi:hypothetical protein